MKRLMTIKEAAEYLKLNRMTVYRLAQKHKIPALKVGGGHGVSVWKCWTNGYQNKR